jgi:hypothetical protein
MANLTDTAENAILNAFKGSSFSVATLYAKLHIGDPTDAGTSNPATETTRVSITLGTVTGGTVSNTNDLEWTSYPTNETVSHISLWSSLTTGAVYWRGALATGVALVTGNNFTIAAGDLDLSMA